MGQNIAIQVENISKRFNRFMKKPVQAVQGLNLEVKTGEVYGFLGPNGAGKTTTIRMLLDLIRPNQGDVYIFGKHVRRDREILNRVGAQVEDARFYPFLTGRRNLEVLCLTANMTAYQSRIDSLLEQVGMSERSRRRVGGYSTGMKQRLGLAAALLSDPDLVILDEPTNGLDPQGIQEMRVFIRELADKHGKTVFLSSHMLNEVEQVCDRVAIINNGQLVEQGSVSELLAREEQLRLEVDLPDQAAAILSEHWTTTPNGTALLVRANRDDAPIIAEKLIANHIKIYELTKHRRTLEEYFLLVTKGEDQNAG
jgi:ABC-2 type transport system ATP-binding protein